MPPRFVDFRQLSAPQYGAVEVSEVKEKGKQRPLRSALSRELQRWGITIAFALAGAMAAGEMMTYEKLSQYQVPTKPYERSGFVTTEQAVNEHHASIAAYREHSRMVAFGAGLGGIIGVIAASLIAPSAKGDERLQQKALAAELDNLIGRDDVRPELLDAIATVRAEVTDG